LRHSVRRRRDKDHDATMKRHYLHRYNLQRLANAETFGHEEGHTARVLVLADYMAKELERRGQEIDLEVVRWAAAAHDIGRPHGGSDPLHGARSAILFAEHNPGGLTRLQVSAVQYCCCWHVSDDSFVPDMSPELVALKDADSLDRVRFHRDTLDPSFLRTKTAVDLIPAALELCWRTTRPNGANNWVGVLIIARRMRLC
jgi:uncharacterized protein